MHVTAIAWTLLATAPEAKASQVASGVVPGLNATQWVGLLSYVAAALACSWRGFSERQGGRELGRVWWGLGALFAVLAGEVVIGGRHSVSEWLGRVLADAGLRESRRAIQAAVLTLFLVKLVVAALVARRTVLAAAGRDVKLATLAAGIAGAVVVIEVLSLHQIDAVLYAQVGGGLRAIGAVWVLCGATVVVAAMTGSGRSRA